jgi:hypothetical protein
MPIRYRRYYIQRLNESIEQQNDEINKKFNPTNNEMKSPDKKPREPLPIPDFATKTRAPRK